jgi:hypothetical protein
MVLYLLQMKVTRQGTQHVSELHHLLSVESTLLQSNCLRTSDVAIKLMIEPDQTMKITISKVFRPHLQEPGCKIANSLPFSKRCPASDMKKRRWKDEDGYWSQSMWNDKKKSTDRNQCEIILKKTFPLELCTTKLYNKVDTCIKVQ